MRGSSACRPPPTPAKTSKSLSGTSARPALLSGALLGVATFAFYMIGSNRSFGYDAAATFANFIATPSIWDAFAIRSVIPTVPVTQVATNDHVLLSLLSHLIFSATGSRSEVVYRVLPALAALGSVVATLSLSGRWTRGRLIAYAVIMGLAIAAQLFAVVVLLCHIAWIATRRSQTELMHVAPAWIAAAAIGLGASANIQVTEFTQHGLPASQFYPTFPRDAIFFLVGAPVLLPMGLWLSSAGLGLWLKRREPWLWSTVAVLAVVVLVLWLGLRPAFLYPRFFLFLVPACGYLMAAAIARWWVLAPVVILGAAAAVLSQASGYTQDPLALP